MNDEFNVKNSSDEDWTISQPNENLPPNQRIIEPIEDWGMTGKLVSPHKNGDGWKMPEPKFRKSDGSSIEEIHADAARGEIQNSPLQTNVQTPLHFSIETEAHPETDFNFDSAVSASPPAPVADLIEPQPDISEVFTPAQIETPPAPVVKERSRAMRIFLAAFGIFAMFAFAVVFIAVVYFLFFYKSSVE